MRLATTIKATKIVSLIDGREYSGLYSHLRNYGIDEEQYREMFGLPSNYPTLHPVYLISSSVSSNDRMIATVSEPTTRDYYKGKNKKLKAEAKAKLAAIKANLKDINISNATIKAAKAKLTKTSK